MLPNELLVGAVDIHVHSGPAFTTRAFDHVETAQICAKAGMRAVVIKDTHASTGGVCQIVQKYFIDPKDKFDIISGFVLDNMTGGLNPAAVEAAIGYGSRVFWMPVSSAKYSKERLAYLAEHYPEYRSKQPSKGKIVNDPPIEILDDFGRVRSSVSTICKLIADADAVLCTGHISIPETDALLDEAVKQGVKNIVVTHPEFFREYTIEQMRNYTSAGFYVEHTLTSMYSGKNTYDHMKELIDSNNSDYVIVSSDLGQVGRPSPDKGFITFYEEMQKRGMPDETLIKVTSTNGKKLLHLD